MNKKRKIIFLESISILLFVCALAWQFIPFDKIFGWETQSFYAMMADKILTFFLAFVTVIIGIRIHIKARTLTVINNMEFGKDDLDSRN